MSALALLILRVGFLLLLWFFIFAIVYALRSDLFGAPVRKFKNDAPGAMRSGASGGGVIAIGSSGLPGAAAVGAAAAGAAAASASGVHSTAEQSPLITPSGGALPSAAGTAQGRAGSTTGNAAAGASQIGPARTLVITSGKAAGTSIPLEDEFITIGRSPDSTLVIVDEYTSTYHARLARQGRTWVLTDLDSTNGTRLAGEKITQSVPVPLNTPVTIGQTTFELRS